MASLAKHFPLAYWTSYGPWQSATHMPIEHRMASLAKHFPLAYWTSYGPWQSATHLPIGHRMASLAKRFPLAYWASYNILCKAFPICLLDLIRLDTYLVSLQCPGNSGCFPQGNRAAIVHAALPIFFPPCAVFSCFHTTGCETVYFYHNWTWDL